MISQAQHYKEVYITFNIQHITINPSHCPTLMESDSDSETIDQIHSPITIEYLVNENKMKQIALNKATNLIDLLKIQLQVQKNSHEESIKIIQDDLAYKYQMEIMRLHSKIQSLQNQLKSLRQKNKMNETTTRKSHTYFQQTNSKFKFKDVERQSPMMRTNNSQQYQKQKRRKFSNKKIISKNSISQFSNNGTIQNQSQQATQKLLKFQKNLLISWIMTSQDRHQKAFQTLAEQYQSSIVQIIQQKQKAKSNISQVNQLLQKMKRKSTQQQKKQNQYKKLIQSQQNLIIQLSKKLQESQQAFLQTSYSLASTSYGSRNEHEQQQVISCRYVLEDLSINENYIRAVLIQNRKKILDKVQMMENQNCQLREILDNMIKLVKNNKKLQIH